MIRNNAATTVLLVLHLLFVGCSSPPAVSPVAVGPAPTGADFDLIELTLLDFMDFDEFDRAQTDAAHGSTMVLNVETNGSSFYISDGQLRAEAFHEKEKTIPPEISADLRRRNAEQPVSLREFVPTSRKIVIEDLAGVRDFGVDFRRKYPDARGYVEAWLPGYSNDGNTAVVRFFFGPTPHGATATYLLIRENGRWTVKWRKTAYYA